jgi:hypothetical protein
MTATVKAVVWFRASDGKPTITHDIKMKAERIMRITAGTFSL